MAFFDRTKKLHEGPDSAINMEYLKNCIFKFMNTFEISEKKRLYPVIATILKFTNLEKKQIEDSLSTIENNASNANTFDSFWGSVFSNGNA
jgi:hypothetical protein